MSEPFLGEIRLFSYNWPPRGWALCQGQILPISQNTALFSLLGTTYGGNGVSTFALPDMRGRTPIHFGPTYTQGEIDGVENVTLTSTQMPMHTHTMTGAASADAIKPIGYVFASESSSANPHYAADSGAQQPLNPTAVQFVGGNQPHNNLQPLLVLNYCIATSGAYPSRN